MCISSHQIPALRGQCNLNCQLGHTVTWHPPQGREDCWSTDKWQIWGRQLIWKRLLLFENPVLAARPSRRSIRAFVVSRFGLHELETSSDTDIVAVSSLPSLPTPGEGAQRGSPRDDSASPLPGFAPGSGQHGLCHSQHDPGSVQGGQRSRGHLPMECPRR